MFQDPHKQTLGEDRPDCRGVVLEADDRVSGVGLQGRLHNLHQRLGRRLAVQDELGAEEPMPAAQRKQIGQLLDCARAQGNISRAVQE